MSLLFQLLKHNLRLWQLIGFAVANLLGAVILLAGLQVWRDADRLLQSDDTLLSGHYLVVSRPVGNGSLLGSLFGRKTRQGFTEAEIAELQSQPSVRAVGRFTTAQCQVVGSLNLMGHAMQTEMFLESVPDAFLDVQSDDWHAELDGSFLPVILPRSYMSLYNFGFANGRGLPQIGEGMVESIPFDLHLIGPTQRRTYRARIIAFSDRLNTILVPDDFLQQANEALAGTSARSLPAQRLIIGTQAAPDVALLDYLSARGYVTDAASEQSLRLQSLVHGILAAVVGLGLVVTLLAFWVLLISVQLLIERNREKFTHLYSLGYGVGQMSRPYQSLVALLNVVVWSFALVVALFIVHRFTPLYQMIQPDFQSSGFSLMVLSALSFCLLFLFIHLLLIYHSTRKACVAR